jgi:replication initiation and membrane attachment protein DnaB
MGYFKMDDNIIDKYGKKIGLSGIGLFAYLSRRANKDGISFASLDRIRCDTGTGSVNTIIKYIKKVEEVGLARKWKKKRKKYYLYHYQILTRPPSINDNSYRQKVNTKEYTMKEYHIKEKDNILKKRESYKSKFSKELYNKFGLQEKP